MIVRQFSAQEKLEIALIENVQREDLTPIEQGLAYKRLMEMANLSQEQIAQKVGKDRSTVANTLRLLKLPPEAQDALARGQHHLGSCPGPPDAGESLRPAASPAASRGVGDLSAGDGGHGSLVQQGQGRTLKSGRAGTASATRKVPELQEIEQKLIEKLGTKVEVRGTTAKGRIEISYFSAEDLERLLETLA